MPTAEGTKKALFLILDTPGLFEACTAFQDGLEFFEYTSGDDAASLGHLELLQLKAESILEDNHDKHSLKKELTFTSCAIDWAATQGNLDVVKWLLKTRTEGYTPSALEGACWNGNFETVAWLFHHGGEGLRTTRAIDYAASNGRLELVKWLHAKGFPCTVGAMDGAAGGGHLDVVRWLARNRNEGCSAAAFGMAAAEGHLHVIQWLDMVGMLRCSSEGLDNAVEGGHLHVLEWMQKCSSHTHQCSTNAYGLAACQGRLEVLMWLKEAMPRLGCPAWAAESAAERGHFEVVKWLDKTGLCPANLVVLDGTAGEGLLELVQWLHEHGAGTTKAAIDLAAAGGHLLVVEYLLDRTNEGCTDQALEKAAAHGHLAIVKLLRRRCPDIGCTLTARAMAEANGQAKVVAYLEESDPGLLEALQEAMDSWDAMGEAVNAPVYGAGENADTRVLELNPAHEGQRHEGEEVAISQEDSCTAATCGKPAQGMSYCTSEDGCADAPPTTVVGVELAGCKLPEGCSETDSEAVEGESTNPSDVVQCCTASTLCGREIQEHGCNRVPPGSDSDSKRASQDQNQGQWTGGEGRRFNTKSAPPVIGHFTDCETASAEQEECSRQRIFPKMGCLGSVFGFHFVGQAEGVGKTLWGKWRSSTAFAVTALILVLLLLPILGVSEPGGPML